MLDPLRIVTAVGPLGLYFLWLGYMNSGRRVRVLGGGFDTVALGTGLSGLVLIGPMELLAPDSAFSVYGSLTWGMLLTMYGLIVSLIVLTQPPSIVLYNIAQPEIRELTATALDGLRVEARWAGSTAQIQSLGIEFCVDPFPVLRNTLFCATRTPQNFDGWLRLERALQVHAQDVRVGRNPRGWAFAGIGLMLLGWVAFAAFALPGGPTAAQPAPPPVPVESMP